MTALDAEPSSFHRLTQALDPDARAALPSACFTSHTEAHRAIGLAGRALRTSRAGMPLHAGFCRLADGTGLLAAGTSSSGKSTMVTLLCRRGAAFISDDTVWLDGYVGSGFGAPIALRRGSPFFPEAQQLSGGAAEDRILVLPADLGFETVPSAVVTRIVFPRFGQSATPCRALSPAEAFCLLVGSSLRNNVRDDFETLATLAATVPSAELSYADNDSCLEATAAALSVPAPATAAVSWIDDSELVGHHVDDRVHGMRFGDEVALWSAANGRIVHIASWPPGATLAESPALDTLRSLAFLRPEQPDR